MATGIPSKEKNNSKVLQIRVTYDGKRDSHDIIADDFEQFSELCKVNGGGANKLFFGDNLDALLFLLNNGYKGKITLIYIDPPFATTSDFLSREQKCAYSDTLCGGEYVEFLRQRLIVMRELLADNGSIYLHLDGNMAFTMKLIMDEIFGEKIAEGL